MGSIVHAGVESKGVPIEESSISNKVYSHENAEFIALARNLVRPLLDRLKQQEALLAEAKASLGPLVAALKPFAQRRHADEWPLFDVMSDSFSDGPSLGDCRRGGAAGKNGGE